MKPFFIVLMLLNVALFFTAEDPHMKTRALVAVFGWLLVVRTEPKP